MKLKAKMLSSLMAMTILIQGGVSNVYAANVQQIPATEINSVYEGAVDSNSWEGWSTGPKIYSEAGIVMDMDSGAILYAKNIDDQHYPASITKVMTALVALEHYEMDETVKFTWEDVGSVPVGYAHIGIKTDEELSMEDCMYGMLLASANEVSHAIGSHIEGGHEKFLKVMNETAKELGCTNSNWKNTNGIHDPEHYTSVRDMALIGSAVFKYDKFREIVNTKTYVIGETNITNETRPFRQNHKMIFQDSDYYYEYCVGGKTGYTDASLTTLVTFATKQDSNGKDVNLVAVVMRTHGGGKNAYVDTKAMLDYSFDNFSKVTVNKDMITNEMVAAVEYNSYLMLPIGVEFESLESELIKPTKLNDKFGVMTYKYQGNEVGQVQVQITQEAYNEIHGVEEEAETEMPQDVENKVTFGMILKWILLFSVILAICFYVLLRYVAYKRRHLIRKRQQMRRMQEQRRNQREGQIRGDRDEDRNKN